MSIITSQISQSSDDGIQSGLGLVTITGTTLPANTTAHWIALRFQGITIPEGYNILSASLSVNVESASADDPDFNIYAHKTASPATIAVSANNISNRTRTTAFVNWTATGIGTGAKSPSNLSAIIQEVVDTGGISNSLMLILDSLASCNFEITAWNGNPSLAAILTIEYEYVTPSFFEINTTPFHGVQATWERIRKRQNSDGSIEYQPYALHTWDIAQAEAATFEALQALQGQKLTRLGTTNLDDRNNSAVYVKSELVGVISGQHEGRRITGIRATFRVKTDEILNYNQEMSETITLSEVVNVFISRLNLSVSETITLSESVFVNRWRVNASETVTLSEAVTVRVVSRISRSETITLSESKTVVRV